MDYDFFPALLEEVALEGLDGITLPMFWARLQNRRNFPIALDDESKVYLWECIALHKDVQMYELPEPRKFVAIYNRYDQIDSELGIVLESPTAIIDMYPIACVNDGEVKGSCTTYNSRVCVTSEIKCDNVLLMALKEVNEKWGEKLVLVASPKARLLALIGTAKDPLIDIPLEQYCLLERIGRSRYHGEVTQGEGGLLSLKAPFTKQIHYYRKKLTLKGLVTKQLHYMKSRKGQAVTGSLFHLTRFYILRKTRLELLMKCMCDILKEKPHNREQGKVLREALDIKEGTFKKLFYSPFQNCVKMVTIPYKEFFPEAKIKEKANSNGHERMIKVVQLVKHFDEVDNVEFHEIDDKQRPLSVDMHFNCSNLSYDVPLISQVYKIIQDAGSKGITAASIRQSISLRKLDLRTLLETLSKSNLIVSILHERGRQKETTYMGKNFTVQSESYLKVKEGEREFSLSMSLPPNSTYKHMKRQYIHVPNDSSEPPIKKVKFAEDEVVVQKLEVKNQNFAQQNFNQEKIPKITREVSEIQDADAFTGKAPKLISLDLNFAHSTISSSYGQLTDRKLDRMKMILDFLKSAKITEMTDLQKHLIDREKKENYDYRIDKKSTARLVQRLCRERQLRIHKVLLKSDKQKVEIEYICDNSVESNDSAVQRLVEQAECKHFCLNSKAPEKSQIPQVIPDKKAACDDKNCLNNETPEKSKNPQVIPDKKATCYGKNKCSGKNNVSESKEIKTKTLNSLFAAKRVLEEQTHPKCVRLKTLHKFLFYLVYSYEGHSGDYSKKPTVYHDSMTWRRFVPALHKDRKYGYCFLGNVYKRMPLSIFLKVFNIRDRIKYFVEYLSDEEKRHYLITDLPEDLCSILLFRRKYLFAFDVMLKCLCYMGLISFGPQVGKLKEEVYLYIHKIAAVKNTTISTPGYIHINSEMTYEKKVFPLHSLLDVEQFWMELENVAFHTPLGKYSSAAGKTIAVSEPNYKPELIEASKNKKFDEILDVGFIPGDGLGAGGFDSSLFLHTRRNWQPQNKVKNGEQNDKTEEKIPTISIQKLLKNKEILGPEGQVRLQRLHRHHVMSQKDKALLKENAVKKNKTKSAPPAVIPKKKRKIKLRTIKARKKKIRQPYFDEKDKIAMQKMSKARCEWFAQEDSFLLLCKVASLFLDPASRTLVVPYTVVRDLLHEKFPDLSENKSSRACQRRVRYMMMNPTTANNVAVFLGEAQQDKGLVKEFRGIKPGAKTNESAWRDLFTRVLQRLLKKFTLPSSDRSKIISLPSSLEELSSTFEIMSPHDVFLRKNHHSNPDSEDEVIYSTLYSLIVSALAIKQDGTEWSYLLHKLYQVYPEYVLKLVVDRLRFEKVIAIKKRSCKRDLGRSLMSSSFPYRFSITFDNAMITKFPISLFNESKELIDILKHEDFKGGLELKGDIAPGFVATMLALVSLEDLHLAVEVPDQIILFDPHLSNEVCSNIVKCFSSKLNDKDSVELSRLLSKCKDSLQGKLKETAQSSNSEENVDAIQEQSKKKTDSDGLQSNEVARSTNASRFALYLLRQESSQPPIERVQHCHDYIVLNSCRVFCNLKPHVSIPSTSNNVPKNQNFPYLMKNSIEPKPKILTDGCISEIKQSLTSFIPVEAFTQRNYEDSLENIYDTYSPQTLQDAKNIFEEILKTKSLGITEKDIWEKFKILKGELSIFEHLHLFRETMLVIRAGVASFVYVCMWHARTWILDSYVMPEICYKKKLRVDEGKSLNGDISGNTDDCEMMDLTDNSEPSQAIDNSQTSLFREHSSNNLQDSIVEFTEKVHFLPRIWRHPDGTLNKLTFIEVLQTVLSYIICTPGLNVSRVTERFSLAFQPVQTLELLEILEKACCIVKYYSRKSKRTLFSKCVDTFIVVKDPDPDDIDHLEPLPDAVCNLVRLEEAIMQV